MMFSNFCLKQNTILMHGISYRGNIPSSFLFTPLSPSSEAEYKTALANSNFSNYL